jgi:hypothetical protein
MVVVLPFQDNQVEHEQSLGEIARLHQSAYADLVAVMGEWHTSHTLLCRLASDNGSQIAPLVGLNHTTAEHQLVVERMSILAMVLGATYTDVRSTYHINNRRYQ